MKQIKKLTIVLLILIISLSPNFVYAQTDTSLPSLDDLLNQSNKVQETLKKQKKDKESKLAASRLKQITREIIRAVNSVPPAKCQKKLIAAMDKFYGLVSDLNVGISCGPNIPPPFLPEGEDTVSPDCILPDAFNGPFSEVYPLYTDARDVFRVDEDENNLSDVCE